MTVTLNPQTEARLREKAEREGRDLDAVVDALLVSQLDWEAQEFEETVAGIQRGLQAAAEGRERPFDKYMADVRARHGFSSSWPFGAGAKKLDGNSTQEERTWEIYYRSRGEIETPENIGKMILIDTDSGDYEIAADEVGLVATRRLQERHPGARLYGLRIGYKTALSFCGGLERLP